MFAVLHKPSTNRVGRFLVRADNKSQKEVEETSLATNKDCNSLNGAADKLKSFNNSMPYGKDNNKIIASNKNTQKKITKIRLSIIKDIPYSPKNENLGNIPQEKKISKIKEIKFKRKRISKEGNFNCGRWQPQEHERFIEAIMKFGNEWKLVQKHVGTRSSTQARSHAQKFFVKIRKPGVFDFNLDFSKNSIKSLHESALNMNKDEYKNAMTALNCLAFERKNLSQKKNRKSEKSFDESSNCLEGFNDSFTLK